MNERTRISDGVSSIRHRHNSAGGLAPERPDGVAPRASASASIPGTCWRGSGLLHLLRILGRPAALPALVVVVPGTLVLDGIADDFGTLLDIVAA